MSDKPSSVCTRFCSCTSLSTEINYTWKWPGVDKKEWSRNLPHWSDLRLLEVGSDRPLCEVTEGIGEENWRAVL